MLVPSGNINILLDPQPSEDSAEAAGNRRNHALVFRPDLHSLPIVGKYDEVLFFWDRPCESQSARPLSVIMVSEIPEHGTGGSKFSVCTTAGNLDSQSAGPSAES